ncbi:serine--tRNA ligase [Candidatus Pacearchaeota archaeon]|nr:serine--tRNA ligase [Candidatus Pacearchaeota archaeon]
MIDIKLIREDSGLVRKNSKNRDYDETIVDNVIKLDGKWRKLKKQDDDLRHERNKVSEAINKAKKAKDEKTAKDLIKRAKEIVVKLKNNEGKEGELKNEIDELMAVIPNIQVKDVPIGGEGKNKEIRKWGRVVKKKARGHLELGEELDILDIKRAVKLAGAGFYVLKGRGAKLQRALIQFMLDFHEKNGFVEINGPQLVNAKTMFGTGNLPKFEDDLYKTTEGLYPVPTAEVPVTNLHSDEILFEKDLPKKYCSFTECYRTEAGRRAGEEGLFRLHQFEKVEMVYVCKEEDSWDFLEEMTGYAEEILKQLQIPYRKVLLATADAGFASAKTYDLEVWSPALKRYLECSSCSNCTDFQARRMNMRYQTKDGMKFAYTLNGSGLALPRLMISLIENNQQKDGSIKIPKVLWKYTGFKVIDKGK